jgi:pyruvate,water dikinase
MGAFRTDWDTAPNPTYDVWTTTNGGEVLPGVLAPFTATMYNWLDHDSLRVLLKSYPTSKRVKLYKPPVGNFFGITAGRLTLNVGFSVAAMSCLDPEIAAAMAGQFFQGSDDAMRLIVRAPAGEVAEAQAAADAQREAAEGESREQQEDLYVERLGDQARRDRELPLKKAWKRLHDLLPDTIELLNRHYVVSTAAGEMQVRLAGVIAAGGGDPASVVGLCSGLGEVESSLPAIALYDLAQVAKKVPATRKALAAGDSEAIVAAMSSPQAAWSAFTDAFDDFIHRYGFRVQGEADPMNADWGEDPTFVISQVRSMMNVAAKDSPRAQIKRAMAGRQKLEKAVRAGLTPELRPVFDAALVQAQRFTRMRELTKAVWVLGTRRERPPLLAVADGLVAAGHLRHPGDMAFCTYAEVDAMVKGRTVDGLAASVKRRKQQWKQAHDYILPDAFVGSTVPKKKPKVADGRALTGLGVSVGVATGTARVIMNTEAAFAREIEPGEILVAPFTDTPWTPLFIPAGAVVVETGGVLSHAATVAREFGIPCVVLVTDATRMIRDGDTVKVDGGAGTVHIVKRAK